MEIKPRSIKACLDPIQSPSTVQKSKNIFVSIKLCWVLEASGTF